MLYSVKTHISNTNTYVSRVDAVETTIIRFENYFKRQASILYQSYCLDDMLKVQKEQKNAALAGTGLLKELKNIVVKFSEQKMKLTKISRVTFIRKT